MERLTVQDKKAILISSLKRRYKLQYDAIQPIPYIKDRLYCVDKVFVEGGTEIYVVEGATKDKEGSWVRVDSYKDIFTDPRMKAKRRIIEAEAGFGKSTVTLQLAYDWCIGVKDSPFKDVEILILLRLRHLNSKISIYQAIKLFLVGPKDPRIKSTDIKDIIESCSSVKVLLDGYNEFPDRNVATGSDVERIITRNLFGNIDVTLTTRYLPKDYAKENTKLARLVGFDEKARDQYIRKAVTGEDEESVAKIKRALKSNPILDALCQVPLFFVMFSHMTHEKVLFMRFNSATEFLRYMIKCFHSHKSNKSMDRNTRSHNITYELKFTELSKVAFEGLCGVNQQLSWRKDRLSTRLGQGFCQHYIAVGILVEEEVSAETNEQTSTTYIQTRTDVRFYHQLFCEWFASFRLVEVVAATSGASELENVLDKVDPFNLQYLYRFTCGINSAVGKRIIEYLKSRKDGGKFAILCILEQTGGVDGIKDTVRDLCSSQVDINGYLHNKLQQRSTIQLLEVAARYDIPISRVYLKDCSPRVDESGLNLILQSGLSLPILSSLQKLRISDNNRRLTNEALAAILSYSSQCTSLKELMLSDPYYGGGYTLPETIPVGSIPSSLKSRNVKVWNYTYCGFRRLNLQTGQWQSGIFTFDNFLMHSESLIQKVDCQKLLDYFKVPAKESKNIIESDTPFSSLVHHLREAGKISFDDINHLITACCEKGLSNLVAVLTVFQQAQQFIGRLKTAEEERQTVAETLKTSEEERQQLTGRLKTTEEERKKLTGRLKTTEEERKKLTGKLKKTEAERQQLTGRLKATEEERQQLAGKLKTTEEEGQHFRDRLNTTENKLKTLKNEHQEAKSSLRATKNELVKSQLEYAKESMALQEVLKQTREALNQHQLTYSASVAKEKTLPEERETLDISQESTLAADYGRLMVNVAQDLTLDSTLKLATLFRLPPAETDMLRRVSLIETPGITLINFMKARNIINMYDVTNLQKGLVYIQLNRTNEYHLAPYQSQVDLFQFEENQLPQLLDWPVERVKFDPDDESTPSQGSDEREEDHDHSKESLMEREDLPKQRKDPQILEMRHNHSYIEHRIMYEGGTISIMGVHLTIPEGALSSDRVIAVRVIYDPTIHLPGSARRGRMTPLIKLEPDGLALNKPAQLTIPHSAIIPEPDRHDVIIFTGLKDEENLQEGELTWTEEKSIDWKLDPEKIRLDITILSYVFVNLVSQETEQKHIFLIVPFIDGILDVKDDVFITVCFCKDSNEEYKLLLEDQHPKLCLGSCTTFQVTRTLNDGRDHVSYIDLIMSSPSGGYHLTKEEATKHVDIDFLCAASRVSHQFRLTRDKDGDTDMVDVKLKVFQNEINQTALILQSKVKNILLSPESHEILHPGLHKYEKLRGDIAKLLDKQHCAKLGVYFELKPAENETIQEAAESGKMLMKILDERELIMPDKMIRMYEGLQAIHFDKVARLVLEFIDTSQEKNGKENEGGNDVNKMVKIPEKQDVISKRESKSSVNFTILIKEGYKRLDVQRALKLSNGKLDLGRRILLLAKEEHERLPLFPGSNLYKEQYFDQHGGEMFLAGVNLLVPAGALHTGRIVSMWVSTEPAINGPFSKKSLRLTPFVKFGPESLTLHKPVTLIIPHCAFTPADQTGLGVYSGVVQTDEIIKWNQEMKHLSCSMNSQHFAVKAEKPCLIGLYVPFIPKMFKRVCVLPIVNRVSESGDQFKIHLWFYNDDSLEHKSLINEEIYQQKGSIIHDPVSVQLHSMTSTLHVSTNSSTSQCNPRKVDVAMETLWLKNRHKIEFHLQCKGIEDTVNLEIEARYGILRWKLFQLSIQLQIEKLRHIDQITSPFQLILPESIIKSFDQLKQNLSEHLDVDQSTLLANIFQLSEEEVTDIRKQKTPGTLLLEKLSKNSLISPTNVTKLENALTEQGNEECGKLVRDFRWKNPVVQATMCLE